MNFKVDRGYEGSDVQCELSETWLGGAMKILRVIEREFATSVMEVSYVCLAN